MPIQVQVSFFYIGRCLDLCGIGCIQGSRYLAVIVYIAYNNNNIGDAILAIVL